MVGKMIAPAYKNGNVNFTSSTVGREKYTAMFAAQAVMMIRFLGNWRARGQRVRNTTNTAVET